MSSNIKPKTGGLAAILRLEKERLAQEEKERSDEQSVKKAGVESAGGTDSAPASESVPPAESVAPVKSTAPAESAAPT